MVFANRDAEFTFLPIVQMFMEESDAIIVWEHGTDARCIPHWKKWAKTGRFFVTLTAHHLATNEDETFGDVSATCKPPVRTEADRQALIQLVSEDHSWVMAGLDDAFHDKLKKHVDSGRCACGAYTSPFGLALYAHALEHLLVDKNGIKIFINFTSRNARKLHNLAPSSLRVSLQEKEFKIPLTYPVAEHNAMPFWAGREIKFQILGSRRM